MTKREVLRLLRTAFIALYDNPASIRRLVDDAGVDAGQINFQGVVQDIWYSVITETERQGQIHALVRAVDQPYQNNQALQQAYQSYQQEELQSRIILRLQEILVKLFPSQAEQRSVANKIFNPMDFTVLEGSAANVWSNILGKAHKLEIIDKLWDYPSVCHYAQQNKELSYCELLWLVSQANLPVKEWQGLYIASFPNTAIEKQPANSLEEAVDNLDKFIVQSDETLPILMFIERLASCVTNETIAGKLRH